MINNVDHCRLADKETQNSCLTAIIKKHFESLAATTMT